jgi:hypothetical protein
MLLSLSATAVVVVVVVVAQLLLLPAASSPELLLAALLLLSANLGLGLWMRFSEGVEKAATATFLSALSWMSKLLYDTNEV